MGFLVAMRTIVPLALAAGINLYLTVLVVGLSIRFDLIADIPPGLAILGSGPILLVAGVLYIVEFIADKVPFIDTLWDLIHTIIRPAGAILIATSALEVGDPEVVGVAAKLVGVNPRVELPAAVIACGVALLSHSGKAGTRTAVNASGGGVTLVGIGLSLLEDLFVAVMAFLALRYPLAANIVAGVVIAGLMLVVPQLLRWSWFSLRSITAWFKSHLSPIRTAEPLPPGAAALLQSRPVRLSMRCQAQGHGAIRGRSGYLILSDGTLIFIYRRWFRWREWQLPLAQIQQVTLRRRILLRVLDLAFSAGMASAAVHFVATADRTPLIEQFAGALRPLAGVGLGPAGLAARQAS